MKIYFAGSIRAGRKDAAIYKTLIDHLKLFGHVLTEHVGAQGLTMQGNDGPNDRHIHDRDMAWLEDCDCVVAEVTSPSLGVGYELGWAASLNKPILCLFRPSPDRPLSAMIAGSSAIQTVAYASPDEAIPILEGFIQGIADQLSRNAET